MQPRCAHDIRPLDVLLVEQLEQVVGKLSVGEVLLIEVILRAVRRKQMGEQILRHAFFRHSRPPWELRETKR